MKNNVTPITEENLMIALKIEMLQKDLEILELKKQYRIYTLPKDNKLQSKLTALTGAYNNVKEGKMLRHLLSVNTEKKSDSVLEGLISKYGYDLFYNTILAILSVLMNECGKEVEDESVVKK